MGHFLSVCNVARKKFSYEILFNVWHWFITFNTLYTVLPPFLFSRKRILYENYFVWLMMLTVFCELRESDLYSAYFPHFFPPGGFFFNERKSIFSTFSKRRRSKSYSFEGKVFFECVRCSVTECVLYYLLVHCECEHDGHKCLLVRDQYSLMNKKYWNHISFSIVMPTSYPS